MSWIREEGPLSDVVLSSRVRLARNIAQMPFPCVMDTNTAQEVLEKVKKSVLESNTAIRNKFHYIDINGLGENERWRLVERHLMSPDLLHSETSGLLVDEEEQVSIMINEEDHIRMQSIYPGYQLEKALDLIDKIDDVIEESLEYSFDEELGYLTACPTNVGTGMRASVMMHLPGLVMTGNMNAMLQAISKIGLTVRGLYGEGSEALGNIFQISNQMTLGSSEDEIISNLEVAAQQIIQKERAARKILVQSGGMEFEDKIWRAIGVMAYARKLDIKEFMALLSQVRLGVHLGFVQGVHSNWINELMISVQPASIQSHGDGESVPENLDKIRAEIVRNKIKEWMNP